MSAPDDPPLQLELRERFELGEVPLVSVLALTAWLLASVLLFRLLRGRWFLFACGVVALTWPLGYLRRRLGSRLLLVERGHFLWFAHGRLGPYRRFPLSSVRSVSEWRFADQKSQMPVWSIVLHLESGADLRLGEFSTPLIHPIVDELNLIIRRAREAEAG